MKTPNNIPLERMQAQVKFFSRDKGFGFLKRTGKLDVFLSSKELERAGIKDLKENEVLEFDLMPVPGKGGKALNLKKVEK